MLRDLIAAYEFDTKDAQAGFVEGAMKALAHANDRQKPVVLSDLADYIGCETEELTFLTEPTAHDDDLVLPEYRSVLIAAE